MAPAHAQMRGGGKGKQQSAAQQQQNARKKQKAAEAEKAYKAALDRIPTKNTTRGRTSAEHSLGHRPSLI
jgi:hypothetical protein